MSNQIKIFPKVTRLIHMMDMIDKGEIKIPSFQRNYVWNRNQRAKLFESIQLEYPIGAIMLWKPEKKFKTKEELGPYSVKITSSSGFFYILDGFQRLSTLFGGLLNADKVTHEVNEEKHREFAMFYDLENEEFNIPRNQPTQIYNIPVYKLFDTFGYLDFADSLRRNLGDISKANLLIERGKILSATLIDYQIPYVEIHGGTIEQAVNIFSRVNSEGTKISKDWMISALTTNEDEGFNLGELIEELLNDLEQYSFDDLKRDVVIQCIQNAFGKVYFDAKIDDLIKRNDFTVKAQQMLESIRKAVQFLYEELLVLERRLLPYNSQLVFISHFFNEVSNPSEEKKEKLKEWFWITSYSNYFTIHSLSEVRKAFKQFDEFVKGNTNEPVFNDNPKVPFDVAKLPEKSSFGSVRYSTLVLFLLNYSNNFRNVNVEEVSRFELYYLFKGNKTVEKIIPTINFFDETNNLIPEGKHKDVSFLLNEDKYITQFESIFLYDFMTTGNKDWVLERRKNIIMNEEKIFVESLGLRYELE